LNIVVVAENGFTRSSVNVNLRSAGHTVTEADPTCLLDVVQQLRERLPHLAVLDFTIPQCNCETLVRIIREDPVLTGLPLLVVHGAEEVESALRMGCWERVRCLEKPLQVEALLQAAQEVDTSPGAGTPDR
jgi:CheY-like chemotaxis protein